jgi:hypothetical protein
MMTGDQGALQIVGAFFDFMHLSVMKLSKVLLFAALLGSPLASPAAAGPQADVNRAFGNTVLTIDPDGRSRKIWLKPDGTWTGLSRRGLDLAGTWTVNGDKVCLRQSKPRLPGSMCEKFPTEFGVAVRTKDPTGKSVQLKLVKGQVRK